MHKRHPENPRGVVVPAAGKGGNARASGEWESRVHSRRGGLPWCGPAMNDAESTLYERIGGEPAVEALVDDLYERVLADPELKPFFENHAVERIRSMQRELFCEALGGPLRYTGAPLSKVHHGKGIQMKHFQRFMSLVMEALEGAGLDESERSEVLAALAVEADDIIGESNVDG